MTNLTLHPLLNRAVTITKGCDGLQLRKNQKAIVMGITMLGAEYSHQVKVTLNLGGRQTSLYARHINRLSDPTFNLNNGNPLKRVTIRA